MEDKHSVKVTIFGNDYTIRGEADDDYIKDLSRYVDGKMQDISKTTNVTVPLKVSILAAVNLADEVFRLRAAKSGKPLPAPSPEGLTVAPELVTDLCSRIEEALQEE